MSARLKISANFSLPIELVTESQAILAIKGAGKTYTAMVQAEEMLKARIQVIAVDPTGAWWGLKSSADGKSAGFPIPIFGGEHADVPLEENSGELVATALVENQFSAVLDLSLLRKNAMRRFMTSFLETLYHKNREAAHLFIDEADLFAPQNQKGVDARLLGAMEDLVRRGRVRGLGSSLITQRPAALHKDVLTQCETICVLRMTHPRDIDPIHEWVAAGHGSPEQLNELVSGIAQLPRGTAWFWSPNNEIFRKVEIREKETFNSSATPKPGERVKRPKALAEVDLAKLGEAITATAEKAKENDPAALKRRIAELTQELLKLNQKKSISELDPVIMKAAIAKSVMDAVAKRDKAWREQFEIYLAGVMGSIVRHHHELTGELVKRRKEEFPSLDAPIQGYVEQAVIAPGSALPHKGAEEPRSTSPRGSEVAAVPASSNGNLTTPQNRILGALAQFEAIGRREVSRKWVAALAGVSHSSSGYGNNLGYLRSNGYLDYPQSGMISLTGHGREKAPVVSAPATPDEMVDRCREIVTGAQAKILDALVRAYPAAMDKQELAEQAEVSATSSGFGNNLGALRSAGMIDYPAPGKVKLSGWVLLEVQ
jgi:hypothetical protein